MKWILIVVTALATLVAVVAIIGSLLPKAHVAARTARFNQPPEAVWQALTDVESHPSWRTDVKKVERLPDRDGRAAWRETNNQGAITLEVVESAPPSRMVSRIADPGLPFGGTWTYEIIADGSGSKLTITERGEVYNPIFRFVSAVVMGHHGTIEQYLKALGKKFGEEVTPVPAAEQV